MFRSLLTAAPTQERGSRDDSLTHSYRNHMQARVQEMYYWDYVVDRYEDLFAKMAGIPLPERDGQGEIKSTVPVPQEKSLSRSARA